MVRRKVARRGVFVVVSVALETMTTTTMMKKKRGYYDGGFTLFRVARRLI
jgi:hypothetical protein